MAIQALDRARNYVGLQGKCNGSAGMGTTTSVLSSRRREIHNADASSHLKKTNADTTSLWRPADADGFVYPKTNEVLVDERVRQQTRHRVRCGNGETTSAGGARSAKTLDGRSHASPALTGEGRKSAATEEERQAYSGTRSLIQRDPGPSQFATARARHQSSNDGIVYVADRGRPSGCRCFHDRWQIHGSRCGSNAVLAVGGGCITQPHAASVAFSADKGAAFL